MQFIVGFIALSGFIAYFLNIDFFVVAKWTAIVMVAIVIIYIISMIAAAFLPQEQAKPTQPRNRKEPRYKVAADEHGVLPTRVGLFYRDEEGNQSERIVRIYALFPYEPEEPVIYINAYCELRNDLRTFRCDRIIAAFHPDTGEAITDLQGYLHSLPPAA